MEYWRKMLKLKLRYFVLKRGISYSELETACGADHTTVCTWMSMKQPTVPGIGYFLNICSYYDVEPNWLLNYDRDDEFSEWLKEVRDNEGNLGDQET